MPTPRAPRRRARRFDRRFDRRTDAQHRAARWLLPALAAALALYALTSAPLARVAGDLVGTCALGGALLAPVVALYRYAVDGVPARRAALEGVATGALAAFMFWFGWLRARPEAWWREG